MRLPVFYRAEQAVNRNNSFSPSAQKPSEVVSDWINHKFEIEIHNFDPVLEMTTILPIQENMLRAS
jgi:hypothetical protein